jgi:hypothetical protein
VGEIVLHFRNQKMNENRKIRKVRKKARDFGV